jgi:hypothetical protein
MSFLKFWGEAISQSFGVGWVVFGAVSTAMPALIALLLRYVPATANVRWINWTADHQAELHVGIAALCVAIYLVYAPYKLYKVERNAKTAAQHESQTLRDQLNAMSPTAQTAEIGRLQSILKQFQARAQEEEKREWPPLSEKQIEEWAAVLGPIRGDLQVISVHWSQDVEAKKLFRSLQAVGKLIGVSVQNWGGLTDGEKIYIDDVHSGVGQAIADLFTKAGYPVELGKGADYGKSHLAIYIPARSTQP